MTQTKSKEPQKKVELEEVDHTDHDANLHDPRLLREHSKAWYDFWGGKCPVCGATAIVEMEPVK